MRIEAIVLGLKKRREGMQESVFSIPPADWEAFLKLQSRWQGLGDALAVISEEVRKEGIDD